MNLLRGLLFASLMLAAAQATANEREEPFLLQFTSEAVTTAGMGTLKESHIPDQTSEIRVWIGFGVVQPQKMLRLRVNADGGVSGEILVHFPSDLTYMEDHAAEFRRDVMRNCTNLRTGKESDVCTATLKNTPSWDALYKNLFRLGITTLPDQSELPQPEIDVLDGIAMVVEVREGSSYRAYEYSNPAFRSEPEAEAATMIIHAIADVFRQSDGT